MLERTRNLCKLFHRDERGQAMVMTAILALVLFRCVMGSYNTGVAISGRIRGQTVADAAAFSGAIWQARFLNYCAYTRRAIIANYAQIGMMNANIANKMALDNIIDANDLWITAYTDRGNVSDNLGLDLLKDIRDIAVPVQGEHGDPDSGQFLPNFVDGQRIAEHVNVILSESQVALHAIIFPIESIMDKIIRESNLRDGEIVQAGLSHAFDSSLIPSNPITDGFPLTAPINAGLLGGALGTPDIPLINMLPRGLVYRDMDDTKIPINEITPLFEHGHTKVDIAPVHWGVQMFQGRPFSAFNFQLDNPDYLKIINVTTMEIPFISGDTTLRSRSGGKVRYHTDSDGFLGGTILSMIGQYLWFYLRIDTPFGPLIIWIATPILGNGEDWTYDSRHQLVPVYEVNPDIINGNDYHFLEPRVYSAVAMVNEKMPYFRPNRNRPERHLNLLNEADDLLCISSAKVYFHPLGANERTRRSAYPDTHYPFYGAKLATIKDGGRRGNSLFGVGNLFIQATRNPIDWLYDSAGNSNIIDEVAFQAFGLYPNY